MGLNTQIFKVSSLLIVAFSEQTHSKLLVLDGSNGPVYVDSSFYF